MLTKIISAMFSISNVRATTAMATGFPALIGLPDPFHQADSCVESLDLGDPQDKRAGGFSAPDFQASAGVGHRPQIAIATEACGESFAVSLAEARLRQRNRPPNF